LPPSNRSSSPPPWPPPSGWSATPKFRSSNGGSPPTIRIDEETLDLVRRLAVLCPDAVIAGIRNRQGRTTARNHRFDGNRSPVCALTGASRVFNQRGHPQMASL
jgi:hypothetical protein